MHPRHTAPLFLGVLLALTGCVAVPAAPPTHPVRPPAGLAPADDRPPAPLPSEWSSPTQAAPREALEDTTPAAPRRTRDAKARPSSPPAPPPAAPERPRAAPLREKAKAPAAKAPRKKRSKPSKSRVPQPVPAGRPADMRALCREAVRIGVPYGVPDLCRSTYGQ
ncbi:hypothetical protein ABZ135_23380 [Streptomyces sp. NPDC006339]|uniref:hypothetical protein n=1 Tax=Streptomyces sp. NPDC006339 TaxID=3156755 RepID=UPI0033BA5C49